MISSLAAVALLTLGSLGAGLAILRFVDATNTRPMIEALCWSFALGFGFLGWAMSFLALTGFLQPAAFLVLCTSTALGLVFLPRPSPVLRPIASVWSCTLTAILACVFVGDLFEALSPPADADSLAYHFAIPKMFFHEGRAVFIERATDGAVPLLPQMTYLLAYGLGGERALNLWCMVSGWGAVALVYATTRRYLDTTWSLSSALIFATLPAVLYGAGTGQIETRLALFAIVGAWAVADATARKSTGPAIIAGLAAGLYVAGKYPGLMFAAAAGGALFVTHPHRLSAAIAFGLATAIAGTQWYAWNWLNTGDPIFPLLFGIVPYAPDVAWNDAQHRYMFQGFFDSERSLPQNLFWLFGYLFKAALFPDATFEAGRTGFGPFLVLIVPFAAVGIMKGGRHSLTRQAVIAIAVGLIFYVLWFFFGTSQRVRHLLPVAPIILIGLMVAAARGATAFPSWKPPLVTALIVTIGLQVSGQAVAVAKYVRHIASGETREAFLERNVNGWPVVPWLNANLTPQDKVLVDLRQLIYLIDVPVFYAHSQLEAEVEVRSDVRDVARFWKQLRRNRITHLAVSWPKESDPQPEGGLSWLASRLAERNCAQMLVRFESPYLRSRTLGPDRDAATIPVMTFHLTPLTCNLPEGLS